MQKVNLNQYDNSWYQPGGPLKRISWYFINIIFFQTSLPFPSPFKTLILRSFGASVGTNCVIKPNVNIKYPWFLELGDHVWIGEAAWIDNLTQIKIGNHVSISQDAYLLTGNHDFKKQSFNLLVGKITIEDGVWIGAKSIICPNITCYTHSILCAGSVATTNLEAYGIYQGNPAVFKKNRIIE